jgi:hypothetical protein
MPDEQLVQLPLIQAVAAFNNQILDSLGRK